MSGDAATALPAGFEDLAGFVGEWGELETQGERYLQRQSLPFERLSAFHAAAAHRLPAIFDHLDSFAYGPLPAPEARLFRLTLGLIEAAQAVEVFAEPRVPFVAYPHEVEMRVLPAATAGTAQGEMPA